MEVFVLEYTQLYGKQVQNAIKNTKSRTKSTEKILIIYKYIHKRETRLLEEMGY